MTNFIPIFPLAIVVYPGESLNLHIFEPRYKQLVHECFKEQKPFGIPAVLDNRVQDYGTLVTIKEITKEYDNGEMDIKTLGSSVFRVLEIIHQVPDKLYSGAIVNYPANQQQGSAEAMRRVVNTIRELHKMLHVEKNFDKENILYFQATSLKITNSKLAPLHIDGDPSQTYPEFNVQVIPNAFLLIQP